jgi:DNA-binding GntR family transcriptional regulator
MVRERGEHGEFVETVTLGDVLGVFDHIDGPVVTSADVADEFDLSRDAARRKLGKLYDQGRLQRRKTAGRVVWWVPVEPTDEELEAAYRRTADRDQRVYEEWESASREATQHLGDAPEWDAESKEATR